MPKYRNRFPSKEHQVRDASAFSPDEQARRLTKSRDRIGRRLMRAAKKGNLDKVITLSTLLSSQQHRLQVAINKTKDID